MKRKLKIHKEGHKILLVSGIILLLINLSLAYFFKSMLVYYITAGVSLVIILAFASFFRIPYRTFNTGDNHIMAPADGRVVVIEEVQENEYFGDKRIQVSIFMSPLNVHVNRFPVSGNVEYVKYHPGLYLVAWHPKSSTENERTTVVVKTQNGQQVLFRQIAGALARRIKYYCKIGDKAEQGGEIGFIKFGSRVDVFLPLGTKVLSKLNETVRGGETVIAELNA